MTVPLDMNERIIRFCEERPEIVAVYVFGSRTRGQAKETSDIDLRNIMEKGFTQKVMDVGRIDKDILLSKAGRVHRHVRRIKEKRPPTLEEFLSELDLQEIIMFNLQMGIQAIERLEIVD